MKKWTMLHITFTDGSNPYCTLANANAKAILRRWKRRYNIVSRYVSNGILFVTMTEKSGDVIRKANREKYLKGKQAARRAAIDWQNESSEISLSYEGYVIAANYFEKLGKRYGLLTEFRENGIC